MLLLVPFAPEILKNDVNFYLTGTKTSVIIWVTIFHMLRWFY